MAAEYHVVPFVASIGLAQGAQEAASQLQQLIQSLASQGWEYVRLESVTTYVSGNPGCFGFGATASRITTFSMAVFRR